MRFPPSLPDPCPYSGQRGQTQTRGLAVNLSLYVSYSSPGKKDSGAQSLRVMADVCMELATETHSDLYITSPVYVCVFHP